MVAAEDGNELVSCDRLCRRRLNQDSKKAIGMYKRLVVELTTWGDLTYDEKEVCELITKARHYRPIGPTEH